MAICQVRFQHYMCDRGLKDPAGDCVWCFIGDGECDEPESSAPSLAGREGLDDLTFVVSCNGDGRAPHPREHGHGDHEIPATFLHVTVRC